MPFDVGKASSYILVSVKVPDPVQPPVPVKVHMPVTVLLFSIPCCRISVLPGGVPDVMVNWKLPVIFPLKFPFRTNDPVSDPPEVKQGVDVEKLRFVPVTVALSLPWVSDVVNARASVPSLFVSVAAQFPETVFEVFELPPPQATRTRPIARTIAIPNCFINTPAILSLNPYRPLKSRPSSRQCKNI
jgi:hypothetical protein